MRKGIRLARAKLEFLVKILGSSGVENAILLIRGSADCVFWSGA